MAPSSSSPTTATCLTRRLRRSQSWKTGGSPRGQATTRRIPLRVSSSSNDSSNSTSLSKEIARLEEAIRRFKLWASMVVNERHIKQARNKQRQIDRMDKVERPVLERRKIGLEFRGRVRGGRKVIELRT